MVSLIPLLAPYRAYIVEFIGTFFLVFTIGLNVTITNTELMNPVAIGSCLMIMVYMGGHISGGHYNPSVTFGVYLRGGKISLRDTITYILVQICAGLIGSLVVFAITDGDTFAPSPGEGFGLFTTFCVEFFWTFALVLMVLVTGTSKQLVNNGFYGLAIGFTVTVGAYTSGGISGGAFNPALVTGSMIVDILGGPPYMISRIWLYWLAALLGSLAAPFVFKIISFTEFEEEYNTVV